MLDGVATRQVVEVLVEIVMELRQAVNLVHHTIGGRQVDGIVGKAIERSLREGMMLGIERDNGHVIECS